MPGFIFMKLMDHTEPLRNGRLTCAITTTLAAKTKTISKLTRVRFMILLLWGGIVCIAVCAMCVLHQASIRCGRLIRLTHPHPGGSPYVSRRSSEPFTLEILWRYLTTREWEQESVILREAFSDRGV